MTRPSKPLIGLSLDAEPAGSYASVPWYALRANYATAIEAAGGIPVGLPHSPALAADTVARLDALVVTGGAFDPDPALYGAETRHPSVTLKPGRTEAEIALIRAALDRDIPVLGICGGAQILAVAMGGTLHQHIPDDLPHAGAHEGAAPPHEAAHDVAVVPGSRLSEWADATTLRANSSHHQAIAEPGPSLRVAARSPDGVIEAVEDPARRFLLGVQWHPEYLVDRADGLIFAALVEACA